MVEVSLFTLHSSIIAKKMASKGSLLLVIVPQQNGVAERKNCTIIEIARIILKGKGLPNQFWAETYTH